MNNYKRLPPFKWFCLTNFPFIEADFDALTNYELLCKVVQYLNDVIIKTNELGEQVEVLTNWFENLDVQDEINHKLDEMVESGELQEIISEYLNSTAIFGFDNVSSMQNATNLINGSFAKTLGYYSKNDGGNGLYKIRTITNDDVIDGGKIIAMTNQDLVAELIINDTINIKQYGAKGDGTTDDTTAIQNAVNNFKNVFIPDGTFYITNDIDVNNYPTCIYGNGRKSIIKNRSDNYCFEFAHAQYNEIKNLKLDVEVGGGIKCMPENHESYFKIDNVKIECDNTNKIIVNLKNMHGVDIYNSRIACPELSNSGSTGIKLDNIVNCRIKNNNIMNHNIGILITDGTGTTSEGIEICENLIYRNDKQLITENGATLFYLNLSNNIFDFCTTKGVEIKNTQCLKVSKNFFGINDNDCVPFKLYTTFSAGIYDESIIDNSFVYYTTTPTQAIINIGTSDNTYNVNGCKIKDNTAITYKTFINILHGNGIIENNDINAGITGNKFIDGDYGSFIIKQNYNRGAVQSISCRDTVNITTVTDTITLTNNSYFTYSKMKNICLYLSVANSETSSEILYLMLKDPYGQEYSIGVKSLKGNSQYDTFSIIIPAQFSFKVTWDASKSISVQRQRIIEI